MTTHLVTGAQGYVGRYLTRELLDRRSDGTVVGVGRSVHSGEALDRYAYEAADILDVPRMRTVLDRYRPERIFHLAAAPRNGSRAEIAQTNVLGTVSLLDAILGLEGYRPRIVIGSSGGVYGALDDDQLPASESAPCVPVDVHGASKLAAEHMARIIGERHGVCVMLARIFNVCGPGQDEQHVCGRLAAQLRPGEGEIRVGNLGATRDFIDVRDVANALAIIGERGACGEAYNVSSGDEMPISGLVDKMVSISGFTGVVPPADSGQRMPSVPRHYGDVTRLRELGFVQRHRIEDSLRDLIAEQRR
ncbi:MAG: NAD-dependent epimerase/dehydratase [Gemmatimonadetes bacterium]|nr:NAD-dependent epimerase/dehydratase [Gemmatimonadota bacterium]